MVKSQTLQAVVVCLAGSFGWLVLLFDSGKECAILSLLLTLLIGKCMRQSIILGGGCFWCTESVFLAVRGVTSVVSGYAGGCADTANYDAVCTGNTGHVEVIKVDFDSQLIDLSDILDIFFAIHDPTTLNRQGNDIGTQYASVIFYLHASQAELINQKIHALQSQGIAVITQVRPAPPFYPAEDYHQNFFAKNPTQSYCNFAIPPKLAKLRLNFEHLLK